MGTQTIRGFGIGFASIRILGNDEIRSVGTQTIRGFGIGFASIPIPGNDEIQDTVCGDTDH